MEYRIKVNRRTGLREVQAIVYRNKQKLASQPITIGSPKLLPEAMRASVSLLGIQYGKQLGLRIGEEKQGESK